MSFIFVDINRQPVGVFSQATSHPNDHIAHLCSGKFDNYRLRQLPSDGLRPKSVTGDDVTVHDWRFLRFHGILGWSIANHTFDWLLGNSVLKRLQP